MTRLDRRRFITISAALAGLAALPAAARPLQSWKGVALGARASIHLDHPDARAIIDRAVTEIDRLEGVFSLYRADSALARLNAAGNLEAPPFELLECLSVAGQVHAATDGLFDPTIQPLWALHAEAAAAGHMPSDADIAAALTRTGWTGLRIEAAAVTLRPGMALTLNGIAQGYVADRITRLLRDEGLTEVLVETGELRAIGGQPGGGDWPVTLASGGRVGLRDRALATSAPLGTVLDAQGRVGHILHPATGRPATTAWQSISISAPTAAIADALSTAACLMPDRGQIDRAVARFEGARVEAAV